MYTPNPCSVQKGLYTGCSGDAEKSEKLHRTLKPNMEATCPESINRLEKG